MVAKGCVCDGRVAPPPLKYIHSMSLHVISDTSGAHTAGVKSYVFLSCYDI